MNSIQLNLSEKIWTSKMLCAELENFLQHNRVRTQQRFKVITCILEALSNVLEHTDSQLEEVVVIIHCNQDIITIDLLDNSPYTDIDDQVSCPSPLSLSGRGLWIIQNWMDQMRFQASVAGTHLRLSLLRS
ncbi:ATP-binding protein [Shewanella eurypsychrophilus]|uniref:ATP-binding protein n=1 Tax=Shewanella eurypsychrophilus TaxID=2593656 RepID=A0ABX6V7L9_9GAMM|nr:MULTISPECIES: ATP-binding protein [Shewanella]QFU23409.1 ATP-binding protein [Shewanella sp. YLB-09]QPG58638.1 ATP-binding protein [Shewanella eurypsychrophilus]